MLWTSLAACQAPVVPSPVAPADTAAPPVDSAPSDPPAALYPDVARVDRPSSITSGNGQWSVQTGDELLDVGAAFYESYPDDYDFLIVWTERPIAGLWAYTIPVDTSIDGIGLTEVAALYGWDYTPQSAGSGGRLGALCMMNDPTTYAASGLWDEDDVLTHEVAHRWGANLATPWLPDPWAIVDAWWSHWTVYANVGGPSALGYGALLDRGDGTFSYALSDTLVYSELELYQQGLIASSEVGPMFWVDGASGFDPPDLYGGPWTEDSYGAAVTFAGERVDFTIDDVVAAHGPRAPAFGDAPTTLRFAFVLVCEDAAACDPDALGWVDGVRARWPARFELATGGRGHAEVSL